MEKTEFKQYGKDKPYIGKEDKLQESIWRYIQMSVYRDKNIFHVPNGGKMNIATGSRLKRMGVVAGVSDLIALEPSKEYNGLVMELKVKGGRTRPPQVKFLRRSKKSGYAVAVVWSIEGFIECMKDYFV